MSLPVAILLVLTGFVILAVGGEILVRGAVGTARRLEVSTAVISLTVVAFATSLPELAVSLLAALRGSPDVATGNVVGSNIFNLAVILGVSAVLFPPLRLRAPRIAFDIAVMFGAATACALLTQNHMVGRGEGIALLVLLTGFLVFRVRTAREADVSDIEEALESEIEAHQPPGEGGVGRGVALIFLGALLLTGGAEVLVRGAVAIAELAGVSERVIALTLVSAGTGLPELATAVMAGIRKHAAVAVGNVIGSNIFNVLGILGTVAVVRPIPVSPDIAGRDAWWMLCFSLIAVLPLFRRGRGISRVEGAVALAAYLVYIVTLL